MSHSFLRSALRSFLLGLGSLTCLGIASVLAGHLYGVSDLLFAGALGGGALVSGAGSILLFFFSLKSLSPRAVVRPVSMFHKSPKPVRVNWSFFGRKSLASEPPNHEGR